MLKSDLFVFFFTQDRDYIPPTEDYSSQSDSCDKMDRDNLSVIKYNQNIKMLSCEYKSENTTHNKQNNGVLSEKKNNLKHLRFISIFFLIVLPMK